MTSFYFSTDTIHRWLVNILIRISVGPVRLSTASPAVHRKPRDKVIPVNRHRIRHQAHDRPRGYTIEKMARTANHSIGYIRRSMW
jgi:hypothetical protein